MCFCSGIWFCEEYSSVLNIWPIFVLWEYKYSELAWVRNRFDCLFVMLILWSQPNLDVTWIMISSYASSLSSVKIGHHRITRPNQCSKIFVSGVYAWEGKNSACQLRTFCLYKAGCMFYAWAAMSVGTSHHCLWNHKGCKVSMIVGKSIWLFCAIISLLKRKKCDGFLQMWIYFHCRMIICGFKTILYWIFLYWGLHLLSAR